MIRIIIAVLLAVLGVSIYALLMLLLLKIDKYRLRKEVEIAQAREKALQYYADSLKYMNHEHRSSFRFLTSYLTQNRFIAFATDKELHSIKISRAIKTQEEYDEVQVECMAAPKELVDMIKKTSDTVISIAKAEQPLRSYMLIVLSHILRVFDKREKNVKGSQTFYDVVCTIRNDNENALLNIA